MRAISSGASIVFHAAVGAALLLGPTKSARPSPADGDTLEVILPQPPGADDEPGITLSFSLPVAGGPVPDLRSITLPEGLPSGALSPTTFSSDWTPTAGPGTGATGGWSPFGEAAPEVLSGPLPTYPELLRQAGVEGQVVLEARVDSTGRVQAGSIATVAASHHGFVEPARRALMSTLFRPARVNGRAVPMLIRVPFAFSIRGGTGRAR